MVICDMFWKIENSKNSQFKFTLFLILKIQKCINKYVGVSKEGIG